MIRKFEDYDSIKRLCYYSFDWDDNILHMDTVIHMEKLVNEQWKPVDISTEEFAKIRHDKINYRLLNDNPEVAFSEFGDKGNRGSTAFLEDVKDAVAKGGFAPSWYKFIDCVISGSLFSIITARGHEPESIKNAVKWIIETQLTTEQQGSLITNLLEFHTTFKNEPNPQIIEDYLDFNFYFGVSSDTFTKRFESELTTNTNAMSTEMAKEVALKFFIEKAHKYGEMINAKVSIGFSDDDSKNVEHIEKLMRGELLLKYPLSTLMIYDTSDRGYRKIKINETHMSDEIVNPDYEFFVVYNNERILSGCEFEQDAWDDYNVRIETNVDMERSISVYSTEECVNNGIDPFDWVYWISDVDDKEIDNVEIMESKKKVNKATDSNTVGSVDIAGALPSEDMGEDKDIAPVAESKYRLMTFGQFSINEGTVIFSELLANPNVILVVINKIGFTSTNLIDVVDGRILGTVGYKNCTKDINQITGVAAEKGYGPIMYEMAMMSSYPKYITPNRVGDIRGGAIEVYLKFYHDRPDVEKMPFDESNDAYSEEYYPEDDVVDFGNTGYRKAPTHEFNELIEKSKEVVSDKKINLDDIEKRSGDYFAFKYADD